MKQRIHYLNFLFRNITVLNSILLMVIVIFSAIIILPMLRTNMPYSLPSIKKLAATEKEKPYNANIQPPSNFLIIADENLFHPERKIPPEKKAEEEKPLPKTDFILYGTLITDDASIAYLEDLKDPYNTPGRGKRQIALKKGDTLSGFTLKEVYVDKVVMVRGEEKATVAFADSHKKIKSGITAQTPPVKTTQPQKPPEQKERRPPRSKFEADVFNFLEAGKKR